MTSVCINIKQPENGSEGSIMITHLSSEEFFAFMDEIYETLDMFDRWDKDAKKGESI